MKVVFLDCDGVMNGALTWPDLAPRYWIDPLAVEKLNQITDATNAVIVISSAWRKWWDVPVILKKAGVKADIIGITPYVEEARGSEIEYWLRDNEVEKFVILDDDWNMKNLSQFWVKTSWGWGLGPEHVVRAIEILS